MNVNHDFPPGGTTRCALTCHIAGSRLVREVTSSSSTGRKPGLGDHLSTTMEDAVELRIPEVNTFVPEIQEVAAALVKATGNGSVPPATTSLIFLRAGQIVGNTYQAIRHSVDLRKAGESE